MVNSGEWGLLKYCLTTKNLHLGRMLGREQLKIPIATHDTALRAVASTLRAVASRIIGHTLSDLEWRQAKLPSGKGGLALSDVLIIADAAHISSHAASARILAESDAQEDAALLQCLQNSPTLQPAVARMNAIYMALGNDKPIIPSTSDLLNCLKQKEMSAFAWKYEYRQVLKQAGTQCSRYLQDTKLGFGAAISLEQANGFTPSQPTESSQHLITFTGQC